MTDARVLPEGRSNFTEVVDLLVPGRTYRVFIEDCCVRGWLDLEFRGAEYDEDDPDREYPAAVFAHGRFENPWTLQIAEVTD